MIRKCLTAIIVFLSLYNIPIVSANEIYPHIFLANMKDSLSVCKELTILLSKTPGLLVNKYNGEFHEDNINKNIKGCMLVVSGSYKALGKGQFPTDKLFSELTNAGWNQLIQYSADGPDGTFYVLTQNDKWIIVNGFWDGGDDSDPNYMPNDNYQIIIIEGEVIVK